MRTLVALLFTVVVLGACGTAAPVITRQYRTTGADCEMEGMACHLDGDCCTQWCVSSECRRREP
jgi:hypothetical protein